MKRNDFREQAQDLISEYGAQYELDGDHIKWWFEADKKITTKLPTHGGDYRGLRNSAAKWRRELEAARPAHFALQNQSDAEKDKLIAYLDKRLHEIETKFEAQFTTVQGEVSASTDIALETGSKVDNFMRLFQGAFNANPPKTLTIAPSEPVEYPKIAVSPTSPKAEPKEKEPPKRLDALEQVEKQQWAEIVARMNQEFDLDELDLRILFFLHEIGAPRSAHTLREAGVWKPISSVELHLEQMANTGLVVRTPAKEWGITKRGISVLQDAFEEGPEENEEGLSEALAFARGEPNHAKAVRVAESPATTQKPTLTVVPTAPAKRILEQVASAPRVMPSGLSVKDELLIYLYWNERDKVPPKTTSELMMVVPPLRGYGPDCRDIGTTASMAKTTGHLTQEYRGGPWHLTRLGREQARRKLNETVGRVAS